MLFSFLFTTFKNRFNNQTNDVIDFGRRPYWIVIGFGFFGLDKKKKKKKEKKDGGRFIFILYPILRSLCSDLIMVI